MTVLILFLKKPSLSLAAFLTFYFVASFFGRGSSHALCELVALSMLHFETNLFCEEKGVRLCLETELCPYSNGMNDAALSADDRAKRWASLTGNMISAQLPCRLGSVNSMSGILEVSYLHGVAPSAHSWYTHKY